MLETILGYINAASHGNPMIAGAVTLAASGSLMYLIKELPMKFFYFLRAQFTTTASFNNGSWEKQTTFIRIADFLAQKTTEAGSRSVTIDSVWDRDTGRTKLVVTIGSGKHFFFYRGQPIMLHRSMMQENNGDVIKEIITLTKFGRSHNLFHELVKDNTPTKHKALSISTWAQGEWRQTSELDAGGLETIALDKEIREFFVEQMDNFKNGKDTYRRLGLAYKMTVILHGLTGSGKTCLIRALAAQYRMNVCILDLNEISAVNLVAALGSVPGNSLLLVEDFDSARHLHTRVEKKKVEEVKSKTVDTRSVADKVIEEFTGGSLSGTLNALDGISSLNNVVVFLTTNHLEKIDTAVYRPGRVDHIVELPKPSITAIREHFEYCYPDLPSDDILWSDLPGCIIHKIKQLSLNNTKRAADLLTYYGLNPDVALQEQRGELEHMVSIKEKMAAIQEHSKRKQNKVAVTGTLEETSSDDAPVLEKVA